MTSMRAMGLAALLAVVPASAWAQTPAAPPTPALVTGTVRDAATGQPIANAVVQAEGLAATLSDGAGGYRIVTPAPADVLLRVEALGWTAWEASTARRAAAGDTLVIDVALLRAVIPLEDVVVVPGAFGVLDEVATFRPATLTREELETVPQLGEDVFRVLQRLPGVVSDDISTRLQVRGGSDRELLVTLEGFELYEPYHLKDFDGALGIVDVNALGGIELLTGGFPVRYGDHLAGVFDMTTRPPPAEGTSTSVGLSVTNVTVASRGRFAGGKGDWLVSARRGYLDLALALARSESRYSPLYYDILGRGEYRLGDRHSVAIHGLFARDHLEVEEGDGELESLWGSAYGWVTWKAFWSPRVSARTTVGVGRVDRDRAGTVEDAGASHRPDAASASDERALEYVSARQEWSADLAGSLNLQAGMELRSAVASYDYVHATRTAGLSPAGDPTLVLDTVRVETTPEATDVGTWLAARTRAGPLTAEAGVRWDRYGHSRGTALSPRVHAALALGTRTSLRASLGRYAQPHELHELSPGDRELDFSPVERATLAALGVERELGSGVRARAEAYLRWVDDARPYWLNVRRNLEFFPEIDFDRTRIEPGEGTARGVELSLERSVTTGFGWSAAYVLSSARERTDGEWIPRAFDQPHALTLGAEYRGGSGWLASATWQYHTGWPITPVQVALDTVTVFRGDGTDGDLVLRETFGELHSIRLPDYHRLDVRVTRRFAVGRGSLDVYVDVFNAYDRSNFRAYRAGVHSIENTLVVSRVPTEEMLPILPSLGLRWEF